MVSAEHHADPTSGSDSVAKQSGVEEQLAGGPLGQWVAVEDGVEVGASGGGGEEDSAGDVVGCGK